MVLPLEWDGAPIGCLDRHAHHCDPKVAAPPAPVVAGLPARPVVSMVESKPRPPAAAAAAARSCAPASATALLAWTGGLGGGGGGGGAAGV